METFTTYLSGHRTQILGLLTQIVEINSFTRNPGGVNRVGDAVSGFLKELGFAETRFYRQEIGDHRLFTRPGRGRRVLFSCHLDTVFPPEMGFDRCHVGTPRTTGPGVIDMKGGIIVLLATLKMLADLERSPDLALSIFFGSDEETGSEDSRPLIEDVAKNHDYAFVFECGGDHGEVVSARKGVGTFRIEIQGKAAHAGNDYPRGINANLEAAHKLIAIQNLTSLDHGTTVNVGQISGGIGANTISPSASLVIDFRYTAAEEADRVVTSLNELTRQNFVPGTVSRLDGRVQRPVMNETESTRRFAELVRDVSGGVIQCEKRGGVGDANLIAALGIPTLDGFGPTGKNDHTADEFMETETLFHRIELLGKVLLRIASEAN